MERITTTGSGLEVAARIATAGIGSRLGASVEGQLGRSIATADSYRIGLGEAAGTARIKAATAAVDTARIEAAAGIALATDRIAIAFYFYYII